MSITGYKNAISNIKFNVVSINSIYHKFLRLIEVMRIGNSKWRHSTISFTSLPSISYVLILIIMALLMQVLCSHGFLTTHIVPYLAGPTPLHNTIEPSPGMRLPPRMPLNHANRKDEVCVRKLLITFIQGTVRCLNCWENSKPFGQVLT